MELTSGELANGSESFVEGVRLIADVIEERQASGYYGNGIHAAVSVVGDRNGMDSHVSRHSLRRNKHGAISSSETQ